MRSSIVLQCVLLHLETGLNGIEDGVYVYLGLICVPQGCLHICKTQGERPGGDAIGRHNQPQHAQGGENAQKEYEYLTGFHGLHFRGGGKL